MKKALLLLVYLLPILAMAQDYDCLMIRMMPRRCFEESDFDSIRVYNESRNNISRVFHYPDTLLISCRHFAEDETVFELQQNMPNPFEHTAHVKFCTNQPGTTIVQLYDLNGKVCARQQFDAQVGEYLFELTCNQGGCYFLEARNGNQRSIIKMIATGRGSAAGFGIRLLSAEMKSITASQLDDSEPFFRIGDKLRFVAYMRGDTTEEAIESIVDSACNGTVVFNMIEHNHDFNPDSIYGKTVELINHRMTFFPNYDLSPEVFSKVTFYPNTFYSQQQPGIETTDWDIERVWRWHGSYPYVHSGAGLYWSLYIDDSVVEFALSFNSDCDLKFIRNGYTSYNYAFARIITNK